MTKEILYWKYKKLSSLQKEVIRLQKRRIYEMERPERPSRHKLNRVKVPFRPTFSSDSESEVNDSDAPTHITYYESTVEPGNSGGPSTSTAVQHVDQSNPDTSTNNISDFAAASNLLSLSALHSREEESRARPVSPVVPSGGRLGVLRARKRAFTLNGADSVSSPSTTVEGVHSPERPSDRSQHNEFMIRPRSFCHIDNTIRPPIYKFKRLNTPLDLTPSTSNRDSTSPVVSSIFGTRENSTVPNSSNKTFSFHRTYTPVPVYVHPTRNEQASSSSILRHFDEMYPSSVARRNKLHHHARILDSAVRASQEAATEVPNNSSSYNARNSLDDYCDLVGNFLFNCPTLNDNNSRRSPVGVETSEQQQPNNAADVINRHFNTTPEVPDIISNVEPSIINEIEINSFLDPAQQIRNSIDSEPMDQGNDDVIVVETPDPLANTSPESYMVPSSRSPSPAVPSHPHASSAPAAQGKPDRQQASQSKEVPMTLKELNQSLVTLFECPVCLDHATPPIYQCCKGHILCQSCHPRLTTCPICRSRLPGDRNSAMEKVAEKLMYPCKNTVTGCSQMLKLDDKQKHEEGCGFRHYACIIPACHWKGYKPELVVHLQSSHPDKLISGSVKELHVPVPAASPENGSMLITHHWIQSAHNEVFNVIFHIDMFKRIMKGCVIYIGSPEKAEKFSYVFELKQRVAPFRKLSYSRSTHADTVKPGQPLSLSNDFNISIDMARFYHDYASHTIPVHISIVQEQ